MAAYPADLCEIVRAYRKDEEYRGHVCQSRAHRNMDTCMCRQLHARLSECAQQVLNPHQLARWHRHLRCVADLAYYVVTTLAGMCCH